MSEPLRVLHVASGDLWAGAEAQMCALLIALHERADVRVAAIVLNPGELAARLRAADIEVFALDESRSGMLALARQIFAAMHAWRPHIVHTHRQKENVLGTYAAARLGVPCVRTAHGASEHHIPWWRLTKTHKRVYAALDRRIAMHAQRAVVAVTDELGQQLRAELPGANVTVIHNGIDVAAVRALAANELTTRPGAPPYHLAIVGRLVSVKRIDLFIDMADVLERRAPGSYRFHIIGDGPLRAALQAQANASAAAAHLHFHGFRSDIAQAMAHMHMLVMSSDHEGLPMTALEALALGLCVAARPVGGLVPLLTGHPRAAFAAAPNSTAATWADSLAVVVESLLNIAALTTTEQRVFENFPTAYTLTRSTSAYLDLYRRLLAPSPQSGVL